MAPLVADGEAVLYEIQAWSLAALRLTFRVFPTTLAVTASNARDSRASATCDRDQRRVRSIWRLRRADFTRARKNRRPTKLAQDWNFMEETLSVQEGGSGEDGKQNTRTNTKPKHNSSRNHSETDCNNTPHDHHPDL